MGELSGELLALFEKYGTDCKRILKENKKLEYLYALSVLRENILEWYEFRSEGRTLQLGADWGALTGLLAARTASVTVLDSRKRNLQVVKARYPKLDNLICCEGAVTNGAWRTDEAGYDYVTLIGTMDGSENKHTQIEAAKQLLVPGGTLFVAVDNRFGLKYMAGAAGDPVKATKRELTELLPGAVFYYPMPDYRMTMELYSDKYLPKKGDLSGQLPLYDYPGYLMMDVGAAFDAVCEDGQFYNFDI